MHVSSNLKYLNLKLAYTRGNQETSFNNLIVNHITTSCFFPQIMVISIFSALLLLVSSSLLLSEVTHLANYHTALGKVDLCKAFRHAGKQTCGHLQIAAVRSFQPRFDFFSS